MPTLELTPLEVQIIAEALVDSETFGVTVALPGQNVSSEQWTGIRRDLKKRFRQQANNLARPNRAGEDLMLEQDAWEAANSRGGFLIADLRKAFDAICNPRDWKAPIKAVVSRESVPLAVAAVEYFTATKARVTDLGSDNGNYESRIESEGYRMGPAGDH